MATTTALIIGTVLSELLKVAQGVTDLSRYRQYYINLACNLYQIRNLVAAEPIQGEAFNEKLNSPTTAIPEGHTMWDRIEIKGPLTIAEFADHIMKQYGVNLRSITSNGVIIYTGTNRKLAAEALPKLIEESYEEVADKKINGKNLVLEVGGKIAKTDPETSKTVQYQALMPKFKYLLKQ